MNENLILHRLCDLIISLMAQMITKFAFPLHQNGIPGEFGCSYDDQALVNVTWHFLTRLEKLFPLQTIQQVSQCNMLIDS